jgi:ACS family hexuronate transporter-like MFS transporter
MSAVGSIGGGWLSQLFTRFGASPSCDRMSAMLLCAVCALPVLWVSSTHSARVASAILSLPAAAHQGWSANLFTTAADFQPTPLAASLALEAWPEVLEACFFR